MAKDCLVEGYVTLGAGALLADVCGGRLNALTIDNALHLLQLLDVRLRWFGLVRSGVRMPVMRSDELLPQLGRRGRQEAVTSVRRTCRRPSNEDRPIALTPQDPPPKPIPRRFTQPLGIARSDHGSIKTPLASRANPQARVLRRSHDCHRDSRAA